MRVEKKLNMAFRFAINYLKANSPIDTGNLRYNSIKYKAYGDTIKIYVDETIAPYMKFTNEPWFNGGNPNEGWWNKTIEEILRLIALYLKGELIKK